MKTRLPTIPETVALVAIGIAVVGWLRDSETIKTVTQIIEVTPAEILQERDELRQSASGLRARIRGLENRVPAVVERADSVVSPPDAGFEIASVSAAGSLTLSTFDLRNATAEIQRDIFVGDCDDGFVIQPGSVICNRARLGHLYLYGSASSEYGSAGAYWTPSYRSTLRISAGYTTDQRIEVRLTKGLKLF